MRMAAASKNGEQSEADRKTQIQVCNVCLKLKKNIYFSEGIFKWTSYLYYISICVVRFCRKGVNEK
jgi:hypothetical protein